MTRPPLPEPFIRVHGKRGKQLSQESIDCYTADQIVAYADTVLAAARDCRSCANHHPHMGRIECDDPCTNADRYEPLPPVRLWRKSE